MSNKAQLELNLTDTGFDKAATDLRNLGTAAQTSGRNIQSTTTNIKQAETQSVSFGQKVKSLGSSFQGTVANVSTLGLSVVNLQRGYRDLGDAQIAVDRTNLKVNKSQEAVRKATDALTVAQNKYGKGSKQAQQASLDLSQAVEKLKVDTLNAGEAQERFGDIQQNFWMGLVPTITSAGGTMLSMFDKLGGDKGIGGLISKFKGIGGAGGAFSGIIGTKGGLVGLLGMAGAAGIAAFAIQDLFDLLQTKQKIQSLQDIINTGKATITQLEQQIENLKNLKGRWDIQLRDFLFGGPIGQKLAGPSTQTIIGEMTKSLESEISRKEAISAWQKVLESVLNNPDISNAVKESVQSQIKNIETMIGNESNWKAGYGATAEQVKTNTLSILNPAMDGVIADIRGGEMQAKLRAVARATGEGLTGAMRDEFLKVNKGGMFNLTAPETGKFAANPTAISGGPDTIGAAATKALTPTKLLTTQIAALTKESLANAAGSKQNMSMTAALADAEANLAVHTKEVANQSDVAALAAKNLAAAQANSVGGVNKLIAAFDKVHAGMKGKFQLPIEKAQEQLDRFLSLAATQMESPGTFKSFVAGFLTDAEGKMKGATAKIYQPLIDWVKIHGKEPPQLFMQNFTEFLGKYDTTAAWTGVYKPATTTSQKAAQDTLANLSKIQIPAETQKSVDNFLKSLKILPQFKQTKVTAPGTLLATTQAKALANAIKNIPTKKVVTVAMQIKKMGGADLWNLATGHGASGFSGIIRRPTSFTVGEGGRPERVSVTPIGSTGHSESFGGGGGDVYVGPIYLDGEQIQGVMRRKINDNQGIFK